jgi:hypothetical protein
VFCKIFFTNKLDLFEASCFIMGLTFIEIITPLARMEIVSGLPEGLLVRVRRRPATDSGIATIFKARSSTNLIKTPSAKTFLL